MNDTARFLADRFAQNGPGDCIEIRTFTKDGNPGPRFWEADPATAAARALKLSPDLNVFYGAAARKQGGGKKADVTRVTALWQDQDFKHYPNGEEGAWEALEAFELLPTHVVHSGNGLHAYWELAEAIADPAQFPLLEAIMSRLAKHFGGLDAVQDVSRVMRLPGSCNNKTDPPLPVGVAWHVPTARYTLADFARVLPEPVAQPRPEPQRFDSGRGYTPSGIPPLDEVRDMLRCIPPQRHYTEWLRTLAAVHSIYPGNDGEAVCEEWSTGTPGEIARKFASFHRDGNAVNAAGVGSLIYEARQHGYCHDRFKTHRSEKSSHYEATPDLLELHKTIAALVERNEQLEADVQRLGDQLRARDAENARLTTARAELLEEVQGLRDCLAHPNQTAGGSTPDILAEAQAAYTRGETLVIDGTEYGRLVCAKAAKTRSAATIGRALKAIEASGKVLTHTRTEQIETKNYKGPADIVYIALPEAARRSQGAGLRLLLPPRPEKKQHGGSRPRIAVPRSETFPDAPLRRKTETWEKFFSTGDDQLLATNLVAQRTDYFTAQGEALSYDEATRLQDEMGLRPAPPPQYRPPTQTRLQVDALTLTSTRLQDEMGFAPLAEPEPEPLHGRCAYCHRPRLGPDTHTCAYHAPGGAAYSTVAAQHGYAYAAGDD